MGGIQFKNYIATFTSGKVIIEDKNHPITNGVSTSFIVKKEEWYTYDKSPREHVHVIAHVDEYSYDPMSDVKMGDHPVIWSNTSFPSRNIYIFMGHSPELFLNKDYTTILRNSILWALGN
jgi:type 1 glutamine amidotransferase